MHSESPSVVGSNDGIDLQKISVFFSFFFLFFLGGGDGENTGSTEEEMGIKPITTRLQGA